MKVLIDGDTLFNYRTGIGNYTHNLLSNFGQITCSNVDISVVMRKKLLKGSMDIAKYDCVNVYKSEQRNYSKHLPYPTGYWRMDNFDLYHEPNYIPRAFKGKTVNTIHDMSHILFPQYHPYKRIMKFKIYSKSLQRSDKIITVSMNSRSEILDLLKVPEHKVRVTYEGASEAYRPLIVPNEKSNMIRSLYKIRGHFLLYVGTIEPRKNLLRLIEAFNLAIKQLPSSFDMNLVIAGGKGWLYDEIFNRVRELGIEGKVVFTGYVIDEHLPFLYNMAQSFVYPSIYEGFGLPPLEAMSCGLPVISSNTSSIPEVVGDAGILVNPYNVHDLAEAIYKVVDSSSLRAELSKKGLLQANKFSWKKCAEETINIYKECLDG